MQHVPPAIRESVAFYRTEGQAESHAVILQTFALSSGDILNIFDYLVHKILIKLFHELGHVIRGYPPISITKNSMSTCHQGQKPFQWKVSFMFRNKGSSGTEDSHKPLQVHGVHILSLCSSKHELKYICLQYI